MTNDKTSATQNKPGNEFVDLEQALNYQFKPTKHTYGKQEAILYALAVGAAADAVDLEELQFTYELNRAGFIRVCDIHPLRSSTFVGRQQ